MHARARRAFEKKWLISLPVALGVAVFVLLVSGRSDPVQVPVSERPRSVRVIEAPVVTVVPRAVGFGNVEPSAVWEAVAQVSGKIVYMDPNLKKGAILKAGGAILRIDPTDYELGVARTEADIQSTEAQLAELDIRAANTLASLQIEENALRLNQKELERQRSLVERGTVSRSSFEQEERALLNQRQSVQSQKNSLNLIPAERQLLQAQLARYRAQLQSDRLDLERTTIKMPFNGRIAEANVELTQYVREGDVMVVADSIGTAEVAAQVPVSRFRTLLRSDEIVNIAETEFTAVRDRLGISARVRLRSDGLDLRWDARLARLSDTLDPQTRTVGVIVEVDNPYSNIQPGVRPPLVKGLFVEVELTGKPIPESLIIPRSALYQGKVYVVNDDDRLERRDIELSLVAPSYVTVQSGLEAGERVVISDLVPAIDGMLLEPVHDEATLAAVVSDAQATGSGE